MVLTEDDKNAIAGLSSGLGTEESDVHARSVIRDNVEAAAYFRELTQISEVLGSADAVIQEEQLSDSQADAILGDILSGWHHRRRRKLLTVGSALAACLCLLVGITWRLASGNDHRTDLGPEVVTFLPPGGLLGVGPVLTTVPLKRNVPINTTDGRAVLKAVDHLVVVLDNHASIQLGQDDTVTVLGGCAYVRATRVSIKASRLTAQCRNVEAIIRVNPQSTKFSVTRGECIVRSDAGTKTLTGGQRALVLRDRQEMKVDERAEPVWPWITESLEIVDSLKGSSP